uniref:ATP-dependent DNA helicase n=1 Tax=Amphimedon queenslandica TaxID=400682 RepID=A0A1X7VE54_AMPQE
MCAIVAPTGIAAFNVGRQTIHRLFQLPTKHEGKTAGYWALNKEAQKRMKMTLKNLKSIIPDEVSMVSNLNLAYLHKCLENIFGTDDWLGSKSILFVGDLLQLPPVNGRPVFKKFATN